jgi:hypothetical protein
MRSGDLIKRKVRLYKSTTAEMSRRGIGAEFVRHVVSSRITGEYLPRRGIGPFTLQVITPVDVGLYSRTLHFAEDLGTNRELAFFREDLETIWPHLTKDDRGRPMFSQFVRAILWEYLESMKRVREVRHARNR